MAIKESIRAFHNFWFSMEEVYEEWAKKYDLTSNALFTLYIIYENPEKCTQEMICKALLVPKQTVNNILNRFEAAGYTQRIPLKEDKRKKHICFTPDGCSYADGILNELMAAEERAWKQMTKEERVQVRNSFSLLSEKLTNELK